MVKTGPFPPHLFKPHQHGKDKQIEEDGKRLEGSGRRQRYHYGTGHCTRLAWRHRPRNPERSLWGAHSYTACIVICLSFVRLLCFTHFVYHLSYSLGAPLPPIAQRPRRSHNLGPPIPTAMPSFKYLSQPRSPRSKASRFRKSGSPRMHRAARLAYSNTYSIRLVFTMSWFLFSFITFIDYMYAVHADVKLFYLPRLLPRLLPRRPRRPKPRSMLKPRSRLSAMLPRLTRRSKRFVLLG